mmetsp:Transcript_4159/g.15685  ORF Transcript_4159/g.15685 Transcript_4159/m.15685 type:complete len:274 (+) Transcript_4159:989-1810(+)
MTSSSKPSPADNLLTSKLYHEYILTLNTLKSHLDRINTLTKLNLQLDKDHAFNVKQVVSTLNEMIDRVPALAGMQKIAYKESQAWNEIPKDLFSPHSTHQQNTMPSRGSNMFHPSSTERGPSSESLFSAPVRTSTQPQSQSLSTTLDDRILQLRSNPLALRQFLDELCEAVDNEEQNIEIEPYQFSRDSFRLVIQHLVDHIFNHEEKIVHGVHLLALMQLNGLTSMFKAVPNTLRFQLVSTISDRERWISEGCDSESINLLQSLYNYLKQITQ